MKNDELSSFEALRIWSGAIIKELWSILKAKFWSALIIGWIIWSCYRLASEFFDWLLVWLKG